MNSPASIENGGEKPRLPRRGDKVIAAPNASGCITGVVVALVGQRLSIQTDGKHGMVHPEFSRFTWSVKKRAWVCWPLNVIREIKNLVRLDQMMMRPNYGIAQVGDYVVLAGIGGGWVVKQNGKPSKMQPGGMVFTALDSYVIATADGHVAVAADNLIYNTDTRLWTGRANA